MTDLLHFSDEPLPVLRKINQPREPDMKPRGLWVTDGYGEGSWPAWCISEGFRLETLAYITRVELKPDANIVRIGSNRGLDCFDHHFRDRNAPSHERILFPWRKVAEKYDGILIVPYLWERRLSDVLWYYGWDCASGCIWNPDAIASLTPVYDIDLGLETDRVAIGSTLAQRNIDAGPA